MICPHRTNLRKTNGKPCFQHQRPKRSWEGKGFFHHLPELSSSPPTPSKTHRNSCPGAAQGFNRLRSPWPREAPNDLLWVGLAVPSFPLQGQRNSHVSKQPVAHLCTKYFQSVEFLFSPPFWGKNEYYCLSSLSSE